MNARTLARLLVACALLTAFAPPLAAPASAACTSGEFQLGSTTRATTSAAVVDSTWSPAGYVGIFHAAWNLPNGTVDLYHCCSLIETHVWARDDYDVVGVVPGTPVTFTAELVTDGAVFTDGCGGSGCSGVYGVTLRHGADSTTAVHAEHLFSGRAESHDVLPLTISMIAGAPETIEMQLWGRRNPGGNHGEEAHGVLHFTGLPPGAAVVSCQGYGQGATRARGITWGRLKTIYR